MGVLTRVGVNFLESIAPGLMTIGESDSVANLEGALGDYIRLDERVLTK